ncbi:hypothetical protein [Novacetimonas maltaceti]|nr:hypothetical protein [Novacetimonas maltaceti]
MENTKQDFQIHDPVAHAMNMIRLFGARASGIANLRSGMCFSAGDLEMAVTWARVRNSIQNLMNEGDSLPPLQLPH